MKTFFYALAFLLLITFSNIIDARRAHAKKHKKQPSLKLLHNHQANLDAHPDKNFRIKSRFIRGTVETFLRAIGLSIQETAEVLRVPTKNLSKCMHFLNDLARKTTPAKQAKDIVKYLNNTGTVKDLDKRFDDEKKNENAVKAISGFIHPTKVIQAKALRRRHR